MKHRGILIRETVAPPLATAYAVALGENVVRRQESMASHVLYLLGYSEADGTLWCHTDAAAQTPSVESGTVPMVLAAACPLRQRQLQLQGVLLTMINLLGSSFLR